MRLSAWARHAWLTSGLYWRDSTSDSSRLQTLILLARLLLRGVDFPVT